MYEEFEREAMLLGDQAIVRLAEASVALFGVGGVGSYAAEALARSGVGNITLIDNDTVSLSNINRQICALHSTIGKYKAEVVADRLRDINPNINVTVRREFILPENADIFNFGSFDYVIDAIDTVAGKLAIIEKCYESGTPVISCMGTGNKLDPTAFCVTDITKTNTCPLARVMRRELKQRGIPHLKVVYSTEVARTPVKPCEAEGKRSVPASISFVPPVAGLIAASEAVKYIVGGNDNG